jgi:hypothetical protein
MKRRFGSLLILLTISAAACGGPRPPLEVGVREFPTNVLFGGRSQQEEAPPPPRGLNPSPGFPVIVQPPPTVSDIPVFGPTTAPPPPCPSAHPFDAPRFVAETRGRVAPVASSYPFRHQGTFENVGPQSSSGVFPEQTTRAITGVEEDQDGSFEFQIEEDLGDRLTTTTYEVVPESPLAERAGLFITQVATRFDSDGSDSFTPQPPIQLMRFPASPGAQWDSFGTDPLSRTTMRFHARIGIEGPDDDDEDEDPELISKARIDACGVVLDAWFVEVTQGEIIGPQTDLDFQSVYAIATQFGTFPIMEQIEITGTNRGTQTTTQNVATISEEPVFPGDPE